MSFKMHIMQPFSNFLLKINFSNLFKKRAFKFINYIPKRVRIVAMTGVMSAAMLTSTFFPFSQTWQLFVLILLLVAYLTTYIAVFEGIDGVEWITLFIMPILFSIALYLFYSMLPVRWLTRLPFLVLFSLGYYGVLLTTNIFNIGVDRSLQLYRAAFSINFLFQSLVIFIFTMVILSFRLSFIINSFLLGFICFILSFQLFWSVELPETVGRRFITFCLVLSVPLTEFVLLLSFIPMNINIAALAFTAGYYALSGIIYNHIAERLFPNVIREYVSVLVFVIVIVLLTISW